MSLLDVEREADDHLAGEEGKVGADLDDAAEHVDDEAAGDDEPERSPIRLAIAVSLPTIAAGLMVGGIFSGPLGRVYAGIAGVLGVVLALLASKVKGVAALYAAILGGLFAIAVAMVVPSGVGNLTRFGKLAQEAANARSVLRPPVALSPGWQFIIGALMGLVGFVAGWVALVVKKPAVGLLLPLPVAAIAAISVPKGAQIPSGIACLALFAVGLGVVSTATIAADESEKPPLSYELRRAGKGIVFVLVISVALAVLAQANILFPKPIIDPTQQPQKPRTVPLSEVPDRVLFTVKADFNAQWRTGVLDVYEDGAWRTPPFASGQFEDVPSSGVVADIGRENRVSAEFTTAGLTGSVLPVLPGTQLVVFRGPRIAFDDRSQTLRLINGTVVPGLAYTVASPTFPSVEELRADTSPLPDGFDQFLEAPSIPPAARDLLDQASATAGDKWTRFAFLRDYVYDSITVQGAGVPVDLTAERVQSILTDLEATPFELVAVLGLLARWAEVPSRLGFGYDRCEVVGEVQECRPRNGATFVEVFFPRYGWLPIVRNPKMAKPTVGTRPQDQQQLADVEPSDELAVQLFVPVLTQPPSTLGAQILRAILVAALLLVVAYAAYALWPLLRKARGRSRRRQRALELGPRARVALAYCEWRDWCTDYGYRHLGDTPLMFLDRFAQDDEHAELAWLTTRCLWGDRQHDVDEPAALACEELSRALRRRLAAAHPGTVRAIAALSRLSLRNPYSPELHQVLAPSGRSAAKEDADAVPALA